MHTTAILCAMPLKQRMACTAALCAIVLLTTASLAQHRSPAAAHAPTSRWLLETSTDAEQLLVGPPTTCEPLNSTCVFIVSTGGSGSTRLQDFLNQLPGVLIHGEDSAVLQSLQQISDRVSGTTVMHRVNCKVAASNHGPSSSTTSSGNNGSRSSAGVGPAPDQPAAAAPAATDDPFIKQEYESQITDGGCKPAWFNTWPTSFGDCIAHTVFQQLYGGALDSSLNDRPPSSSGASIMGFKEIRYKPERAIHTPETYQGFNSHLNFLSQLCTRPKLVFSLRRNATAAAASDLVRRWPNALALLTESGAWFQRFAAEHPKLSFTAHYEDLLDRSVNASLAQQLAEFVGVPWSQATGASFARLR